MYVKQNFVSTDKVKSFQEGIARIGGIIPENRLLILSPNEQETKIGSIIVPGTSKDQLPRKGVIIQCGEITEENITFRDMVKPGRVITYGLYAGKEIDFPKEVFPIELRPELEQQKFTVISLTEVVYTESNPSEYED